MRPWFDEVPTAVGCRVIGVRCSGGCAARWGSERIARIYEDVHGQMETTFHKMVTFMDFPVDARKEEA